MDFVRCDGERLTLVFALERGGTADCIYVGARLPANEDLAMLAAATARGRHESQPDVPPVPGLLPERKGGWSGTPALELRRGGIALETDLRATDWQAAPDSLEVTLTDDALAVSLSLGWRIAAADVIEAYAVLVNRGEPDLELQRLAAPPLPLPRSHQFHWALGGRDAGTPPPPRPRWLCADLGDRQAGVWRRQLADPSR